MATKTKTRAATAKSVKGPDSNGSGPYLPKEPRTEPYTWEEIAEVPCVRCGGPSKQQWNVCSLDPELNGEVHYYWGMCNRCDVLLNKLTLRFFQFPDADELVKQYVKRLKEFYEEEF